MNRKVIQLFILFLLLFALALSVQAHSGGTDGIGGHYDSDTGEYHYHHGYPSHGHYDMDGDGTVDCPYEFVDRTASDSSSNFFTDNTHYSSTYQNEDSAVIDIPDNTLSNSHTKEAKSVPIWVYIIFAVLILICLGLFLAYRHKVEYLQEMKNSHASEIDSLHSYYCKEMQQRADTARNLESLKQELVQVDQEKRKLVVHILQAKEDLRKATLLLSRVKKAPSNVFIDSSGMPVYWKYNPCKPYGDYPVYISNKSKIYHINQLCCSYNYRTEHIFNVIGEYHACKKCAEGFFDFTSVPDWFLKSEHSEQ